MDRKITKDDFGELNADGSIKRDAQQSILSGRPVQPGDVRIRVTGTPYFYWILATEKRNFTPEARAEIEAVVKPAKADAKPAPEAKEK
jgi:hypothetical protein